MIRQDIAAVPQLSGVSNFRSLGGLRTVDGCRIRPNYLMRSERLCTLTPEDWRRLAATGLKTICDLRSDHERAHHPNGAPPELALNEIGFDITNDIRGDDSLLKMLDADPTPQAAARMMTQIYRRLPEHLAKSLRALSQLLGEDGAPLLIHCTAGKDRTGFAVAMLLHALGVARQDIYADYLISRSWPGAKAHRPSLQRRVAANVPPAAVDAVVDEILDVREGYLDAAFATLDAQWGSADRYLKEAVGLDQAGIGRLRGSALL